MEIAKMTTKGQITLPINLRKKLGLRAGDQVVFVEKNGEICLLTADRLTVKGEKVAGNVQSVVSSMYFEGFDVSDESLAYMQSRANGEKQVEERIAELKKKYAREQ